MCLCPNAYGQCSAAPVVLVQSLEKQEIQSPPVTALLVFAAVSLSSDPVSLLILGRL